MVSKQLSANVAKPRSGAGHQVGPHPRYLFPDPDYLLKLEDPSPRWLRWAKTMPSMLLAWGLALILSTGHDCGQVSVLK